MPEEYYTGRILKTIRVDPCVVDGPRDTICDQYSYPDVSDEHAVKHEAENGYFAREAWGTDDRLDLKYYSNNTILKQLKGNQLVLMNSEQVFIIAISARPKNNISINSKILLSITRKREI